MVPIIESIDLLCCINKRPCADPALHCWRPSVVTVFYSLNKRLNLSLWDCAPKRYEILFLLLLLFLKKQFCIRTQNQTVFALQNKLADFSHHSFSVLKNNLCNMEMQCSVKFG